MREFKPVQGTLILDICEWVQFNHRLLHLIFLKPKVLRDLILKIILFGFHLSYFWLFPPFPPGGLIIADY